MNSETARCFLISLNLKKAKQKALNYYLLVSSLNLLNYISISLRIKISTILLYILFMEFENIPTHQLINYKTSSSSVGGVVYKAHRLSSTYNHANHLIVNKIMGFYID